MADVEMILRQSIIVLVESLHGDDDLRLRDLGRLWVEQRAPYTTFSNLPGHSKQYTVDGRKVLQFQASARVLTLIRSDIATHSSHAHENHED
jgi:nucleoid DNA-binding protein